MSKPTEPMNTADGAATRRIEFELETFLSGVGNRVRHARARKNLSRRALSQASGVSQRYLAQLESGEGNISISLLLKIAIALDSQIEYLVADKDHGQEHARRSDDSKIAALYRRATTQQRNAVHKILAPEHKSLQRANRYALIGMRGAGKSTLGQLAAKRLDLPFVELNDEIERASGMPVHEVFVTYGQEGYRMFESKSLEKIVASHDTAIVAVAGGIVSDRDSFDYLLQHTHTMWLQANPEDHMARVLRQGDKRPMADNPDAMADLRTLLASREQMYSRAEVKIDTSHTTIEEALQRVVEVITEATGARTCSNRQ